MMLTNSALLERYIAFWLHYSVVLEIKQYVGFINIQPILHCGEKKLVLYIHCTVYTVHSIFKILFNRQEKGQIKME
jgi:hypothetical protein